MYWGYCYVCGLTPYKLIVTGRIKHFISEYVIGSEVEGALQKQARYIVVGN